MTDHSSPANAGWTPDQFWEYVGGLAGEFEAGQMRDMMVSHGLSLGIRAQQTTEPDPPAKWLDAALRDLARELVADPKTPWIGDRDPKLHICWTAADRLLGAAQGTLERLSIEKLAKHFRISVEQAKAAQDDIGFMYRERASSSSSPERSPLMRAAEKAQKTVESWSDAKQDYAERVVTSPESQS